MATRATATITMSMQEVDRVKTVQAVVDRMLPVGLAAKRLGLSRRQLERLHAARILQAQRDDRRLEAPSRTHRGQASQPLRAAFGARPASQFTSEAMAIAVRQACSPPSPPSARRHRAVATT